jgi:hypothetical protein
MLSSCQVVRHVRLAASHAAKAASHAAKAATRIREAVNRGKSLLPLDDPESLVLYKDRESDRLALRPGNDDLLAVQVILSL